MAKKADKPAPKPAAGSDSAAEQLAVIQPDVEITVAGRAITVREYGFFDGLAAVSRAGGFVEDLVEVCRDGDFRYERIRPLFGRHADEVVVIVAQAAGVEPEWVEELNRTDAETLMSVWFSVNASFFVREAVVTLQQEVLRAALSSAGSTSSPGSPKPGSATSTASGA